MNRMFFLDIIKNNISSLLKIIMLYAVISILGTLSVYGQKLIIDGIFSVNLWGIGAIILIITLLSIFLNALEKASALEGQRFSMNVSLDFNQRVTKKLNGIRLEQMEEKNNLDLIDRIQKVASILTENVLNSVNILSCIFSFISMAAVLATVRWYFIIFVLILSSPYLLLIKKQGFDNYLHEVRNNTDIRRLGYIFDLLTIREYAKEIRTFNLKDYLSEKFFDTRKSIWRCKRKMLLKHSLLTILVTLLKNLSLLVCILFTVYFIVLGKESIGSLILVITAAESIGSIIKQIFSAVGKLNKQKLYSDDLYKFLNLEEENKTDNPEAKMKHNGISFHNVSFSYPNSNEKALDTISVEMLPSEKVAIIGENGSGKSTFIKLLLGIYQPTEGRILVGGQNLNHVLEEFRRKAVCVFQDFIKYQYSIYDNIDIGNYGNRNEEFYLSEDIFFMNFIKDLPDGYDTILGRMEDGSRDISGGEWQKVAVSRALSRENSQFIILDEPMAALDPLVESELYKNFAKLCKNRTALLISHRLSATQVCDRILVFDKGKVVEQGNHAELMQKEGKYYQMYTAQQQLYL